MSDMAKQARAAMKAKAKSLTSADPSKKVDSSTWTPPEPLDTTAKTGMRPVSRRAFKSGGKVEGEKAKCNMGRKPRKSGGEATSWINAKINRNVKDANEEREGIKHVGGMKKGGRAAKQNGGGNSFIVPDDVAQGKTKVSEATRNAMYSRQYRDHAQKAADANYEKALARGSDWARKSDAADIANKQASYAQKEADRVASETGRDSADAFSRKSGGRSKRNTGGGTFTKGGKDYRMTPNGPRPLEDEGPAARQPPIPQRPQRTPEKGMTGEEASEFMKARKSGGRAKKAGGGDLEMYGKGVSGAAEMMKKAGARAGVPGGLYGSGFTRVGAGKLSPAGAAIPMARMKKGGEAKHPDEKMDIALIKKMVKPEARKAKKEGGFLRTLADRVVGDLASDEAKKLKDKIMEGIGGNMKKGGRAARKEGGGVFSGPGYPGKIPGVVPGGREARATGGKTKGKGKTNINIIIAAGKPASAEDMMAPGMGGPTPPPGLGGAPGGVPVPVPAAGGAPGGAPMPMPIPMPMPAAGGAGPMPTPRKDGGRLTKVASSFKDMQAGAGSGEGRLQKTDIAKARMGRRAGGKTYRSYKDMDAGAGSGLGRLEKTEIQARKG